MNTENNNRKSFAKLGATRHVVMGIIYLLMALLLFYVKRFGSIELPNGVVYALSVLLVIYGAFRLWRGIADFRNMGSGE
jgi:hypothetical protein